MAPSLDEFAEPSQLICQVIPIRHDAESRRPEGLRERYDDPAICAQLPKHALGFIGVVELEAERDSFRDLITIGRNVNAK